MLSLLGWYYLTGSANRPPQSHRFALAGGSSGVGRGPVPRLPLRGRHGPQAQVRASKVSKAMGACR